jgi:hypothetical protein
VVAGIEVLAHQVGDEIRIEWFDPTAGSAPLELADGTLLVLDFEATGAEGDSCTLEWSRTTALGDVRGDPIRGLALVGGRIRIGSVAGPGGSATSFALHPVSPNPLTDRALIRFALTHDARTRLEVFDVNGRLVRTLVDAPIAPGEHAIEFDGMDSQGSRVEPGVYLLRLTAAGASRGQKFVVVP